MSILNRLKDIIRANLNDLITKAEDPEKALNLYIEDATDQFREFTVEVNRFEAERILIQNKIKDTEALANDWHEKARLALTQSREDLARQSLEKENQERQRLAKLQVELTEADQTVLQLREQHRLLEQKLSEARERRDDLVRRNRRAVAQKEASEAISGLNREDPLSKFDRIEEKVQRREAEAKAAYVGMTTGLDYELDQLKKSQSSSEVEDALAKLKEELNSK